MRQLRQASHRRPSARLTRLRGWSVVILSASRQSLHSSLPLVCNRQRGRARTRPRHLHAQQRTARERRRSFLAAGRRLNRRLRRRHVHQAQGPRQRGQTRASEWRSVQLCVFVTGEDAAVTDDLVDRTVLAAHLAKQRRRSGSHPGSSLRSSQGRLASPRERLVPAGVSWGHQQVFGTACDYNTYLYKLSC